MEIVGIDVGFGFTKAYNGRESIVFKSVIGEATDIQFHSHLGDDASTSNLHITLEGKSYFIGSYAELQSKTPEFTLDQEALVENFIKILAVTAAGLCCDSRQSINMITGLPVEYLRRDSKRLKEMILGTHEITFHKSNGKDETKRITIDDIYIIPQPIGSIFNLIFDDQGKIKDRQLAAQKLGVVDIGFKTTDFSIFDRLQYIERSSSTMDTGISKCFAVIADKLKQESNINLELYRIFKFIDSGKIKIRGKEYNITNLKKKVYTHAAAAIASDINRMWENDWDIDSIILSGGGSVELAEYLSSSIKGHVIPVQDDMDPRLNNVLGYRKFGQHKWGAPPHKERAAIPDSMPVADSKEEALEYIEVTNDPHPLSDKTPKAIMGRGWLKR